MRRRPRPGVTAAATTAVFATGEGPGETALATTAVLATGWPMTPTLPTRAGLNGMSVSFNGCVVGFDRREDRLDGDTSVRDELPTGAPRRGGEGSGPQVLPDEDPRSAARVHGGGQVRDVVRREQLGQLGLELLKRPEVLDVGQLHRIDRAVRVLGEDQD